MLVVNPGTNFLIRTLEINAGRYQIFDTSAADARVVFENAHPRLDPVWWGAKYDGVTDDLHAIQAAIDTTGNLGPARRAGTTIDITGPVVISDTIKVDRRSITIRCHGLGDIERNDPRSHYIRADPTRETPWGRSSMLEVKHTMGRFKLSGCRFIGDPNNRPYAAISLKMEASNIPNSWNRYEDIEIGKFRINELVAKDPDDPKPEAQFVNGFVVEGISQNNDLSILDNIRVQSVLKSCFRFGSIQAIGFELRSIVADDCEYGIWTASTGLVATKLTFLNNKVDIYYPEDDDNCNRAIPTLTALYSESEGSSRFWQTDGAGRLSVLSGRWQAYNGRVATDEKVIVAEGNLSAETVLRLQDFKFHTDDVYSGNILISVNPTGWHAYVVMNGVIGIPMSNISVTGKSDISLYSSQ